MNRFRQILVIALLGTVVLLGLMAAVLMIRFSPLWSQEASGWAQAVGAVVAILASGAIASWQSRRQYEDARRLDAHARAASEVKMIEAIAGIVDVGNKRTYQLIRNFGWDREQFHSLAEDRYRFDMKAVKHAHDEYSAITLPEMPNARVISEVIRLRSITRQMDDHIERALDNHRNIDGAQIANFFHMLDDAHAQLCIAQLAIDKELTALRVRVQS